MIFAIVFAVTLCISVAASPQAFSDGGADIGPVVTIDDVIAGADYTLPELLGGRIIGLSDHSINGVKGVAFTKDSYLVGLPGHAQAVLLGIVGAITEGCRC